MKTTRSRLLRGLFGAVFALICAACFLASDFAMEIELEDGGVVTLGFEGTLVYLPARVAQVADRPQAQAALARLAGRIGADPGTRRLTVADDQIELTYKARFVLAPGEAVAFPPVGPPAISVSRDAAGMTLRGLALPADAQRAAERGALTYGGVISVRIRGGLTPVESNSARPTASTQSWTITSFRSAAPFLRVIEE